MEKKPGMPDLDSAQKLLAKERAKYEAKKDAFEGMEEKLEAEFKANLDSLLSDEEREILELDGDPGKQYDLLMSKRRAFVDDKIADEKAELEAFEEALEKKETVLEDLRAEAAFREENPDLDADGFAEYLNPETGKLSPYERAELIKASEGDRVKFLGLAAEKFLKATGAKKEGEEADLPTDMGDIAGETGDVDSGDGGVETDDLADVMGMNR